MGFVSFKERGVGHLPRWSVSHARQARWRISSVQGPQQALPAHSPVGGDRETARVSVSSMAVTLHLRVKVTRQYPQTTTLEEKDREPNRLRTEVAVLNDQPDALLLGQTGSHWNSVC